MIGRCKSARTGPSQGGGGERSASRLLWHITVYNIPNYLSRRERDGDEGGTEHQRSVIVSKRSGRADKELTVNFKRIVSRVFFSSLRSPRQNT